MTSPELMTPDMQTALVVVALVLGAALMGVWLVSDVHDVDAWILEVTGR